MILCLDMQTNFRFLLFFFFFWHCLDNIIHWYAMNSVLELISYLFFDFNFNLN